MQAEHNYYEEFTLKGIMNGHANNIDDRYD